MPNLHTPAKCKVNEWRGNISPNNLEHIGYKGNNENIILKLK